MRSKSSSSFRRGAPARPSASAVDAGLRLLARRAHSAAELRTKLRRRGYVETEIELAMARLDELGYLDDQAFAAGHVRRRGALRGPLALARELALKGVDRSLADEALVGFDVPAQLASATRLAERLYGRHPSPGYREMLNRVGPKLLQRGFSMSVARAACAAVWRGTQAEPEA